MADKGWIALHRNIRDHWVYQEKRVFSKYEAWLDLLMDANHQNNKFLFDGQLIEVNRGEFITSVRQLCERWGWSNTKVNRFLKMLEDDQMLIRKSDSKKTVITIVNYDFYQRYESKETTQKRQQNDAEASQKHTNNNDKTMNNNVNNNNPRNSQKTREYADDDPNKKLAILLLKLIRKNQNIKEPNLDKWANTIRLTIEADKRTGKEVQDMIVWSTSDEFWSGVILSPTSLRKHFDKMAIQKNKRKQQNISNDELPETGEDW
ncbi:hypothetical protein F6X95_00025 [Enterococcus durans]|uniref:Uncharacterized protein n=1 Tax=Enterococcus durans TaxID=53345 RepID=A0A5N0Z019_9ENTE|nr:hypothetical protein [Enterococcus durans]KAA9187892.1 hypothetical protein F6X90_03210 [Enterococcus durans]KAA9188214.1 hypothetical protein F6X85_03305 [Enterococcus durans]KAA9189835.1 hypothetical protein F6X87_14340 [Enterococcus durans]KAA9191254.1 hypothetical protein F6X88_11225 [Enterococcus durans]KAA9193902.1 hypothetical protein F6Y12_03220 [Enterococcus durans]